MTVVALADPPLPASRADKLGRVDAVIAALGLNKCRDTMIGSPQMRGVSGGERKRVSVGHELLINPSVLMLDEPTSGLDSTTAMHLIDTLRELATGAPLTCAPCTPCTPASAPLRTRRSTATPDWSV